MSSRRSSGKSRPSVQAKVFTRESGQKKPNPETDSTVSFGSSVLLVNLWVHDDNFSKEEVLIDESLFQGALQPGDLVEILGLKTLPDNRDTPLKPGDNLAHDRTTGKQEEARRGADSAITHAATDAQDTALRFDYKSRYLCRAKFIPQDVKAKHPSMQISVSSGIASTFGFRNRSQVAISLADLVKNTASHVEIGFRDAYLARSDMWRLVISELVGKTVHIGQKIQFLGTIRATIKSVHVQGHKVSTALFSGTTLPIFRSEAARFVLFIQMSREMWDFDSEGNGEILFNRVINGFLPDLFRRWSELEVKHLVSIVMFGRLEYSQHDLDASGRFGFMTSNSAMSSRSAGPSHKDFYRVVVTDMASAQWTTILDELKKDFRVFLRDVCLEPLFLEKEENDFADDVNRHHKPRISGRPSTALKGNVLEAINIAASQFANDYLDRDLVRTGVSVVVVTAGTGIFEVEKDLLNLTSENLTNNGIGIDVVCLSRMPLHSAPLFKYRDDDRKGDLQNIPRGMTSVSESPRTVRERFNGLDFRPQNSTIMASSFQSSTPRSLSRFTPSFISDHSEKWCYGIPQWIDLSYWASTNETNPRALQNHVEIGEVDKILNPTKTFVPRVRMYSLQMMGLMELGLADIAIPYMSLSSKSESKYQNGRRAKRNVRAGSNGRFSADITSHSHNVGMNLSPTPFKSGGLLPANIKEQGGVIDLMNRYDQHLFSRMRPVTDRKRTGLSGDKLRSSSTVVDGLKTGHGLDLPDRTGGGLMTTGKASELSAKPLGKLKQLESPEKQNSPSKEISQAYRSISLAFRGLANLPRAVPSTGIVTAHAQAQPQNQKATRAHRTLTNSSGNMRSLKPSDSVSIAPTLVGTDDGSTTQEFAKAEQSSVPISIGATGPKGINKFGRLDRTDDRARNKNGQNAPDTSKSHEWEMEAGRIDDRLSSENDISDEASASASLPRTLLPFIRNVNASNPIKKDPDAVAFYGRWQHLYPRKPKASTVKWRSLCTPASVPLTTEGSPNFVELETKYNSSTYYVSQDQTNELLEHPHSRETLLQEMISIRLAHGYQLIVHPTFVPSPDIKICTPQTFFAPANLARDCNMIFMSMGNTIQSLAFGNEAHIKVTKSVRKPAEEIHLPKSISYRPNIRTILSEMYDGRPMELSGFSEEYPWELADGYLAGKHKDMKDAIQQLRFWRARFVLLPVDPPAFAWKHPQYKSEENDEEVHLLGIRELTKMWQKIRFVPAEERKFKSSAGRRRDPNPLEINIQTLNPSEVVATELDKLLATDELAESQSTQLLPDSELFDRDGSTLQKIAQALQGERGIEIKNRRWHWRLHYNCFKGEEFVNWILVSFSDIETREEAVEFGNELMNQGLFQHVKGRHVFKDGNYFYSLEPDFRTPRSDSRQSWLLGGRRSEKSVPPTPISEHTSRDSPMSVRSRSGSNHGGSEDSQSALHPIRSSGEKKRISISLSKMIRLDLDHRKRSNRMEIVNLHYDRIHNPENCYHLELSWLNVTSKLVEDVIVSWASQAERYGLKLVEVPIAEASKVSSYEPFRAPHRIHLITPPPKRPTYTNTYFTPTSFTPQLAPGGGAHMYQKALLKRFNFVLDLEAASEFPEDVDILYSWGKLEYHYTQFVHRSGVVIAQITDEGDFLLLANRLYNTRYASAKDHTGKFDVKKDHGVVGGSARPVSTHQPGLQASGILGMNHYHYSSPAPSPLLRATTDLTAPGPGGIGIASIRPNTAAHNQNPSPVPANASTGTPHHQYISPEQVKVDLEAFCSDKDKLEAFYKEVTGAAARKSSSTSSSVLRPVPASDAGIPDIRLPPSLVGGGVFGFGAGNNLAGNGSASGNGGSAVAAGPASPAAAAVVARKVSPHLYLEQQQQLGETLAGTSGDERKTGLSKSSSLRKNTG